MVKKIGRPRRFTPKQVGEALRLSGGVIAAAAEVLQTTRSTITSMIEDHVELQTVVSEVKDRNLDICVSKLLAAIGRGEPWAIRFYLERMGRAQGWGANVAQVNAGNIIKICLSDVDMLL